MQNLRNRFLVPVAVVMVFCFAVAGHLYAKPLNPQSDATVATQRPGDAYQNGYGHGRADAQTNVPRNNLPPSDQWTTDEARRAYREGYDAGYDAAPGSASSALVPNPGTASAMATDMGAHADASRFGYDDGLAAGRKDHDSGHSFKPTDSEMYKKADHGWTADFGDKGSYRQLYRQSYAQGYEDGYGNHADR